MALARKLHRSPVLWLLLCVGPALAQTGPGRIAVAGVYPNGYVGCLARYGLPRDLLSDDQLADPEVVARYDLLIVGGLPPELGEPRDSFAKLLAKGGSLLVDCSGIGPGAAAGRGMFESRNERGGRTVAGVALDGLSRSPFRPKAGGPLAGDAGEQGQWAASRMGVIPLVSDPAQTTVLAEYLASAQPRQWSREQLERLARTRTLPPDSGPAAPAIVLRRQEAGQVVVCGPAVGLATALMGEDYDSLILGLVRLLTGGRAVPQIAPEGPHLGRKQSLRTRDNEEAAAPEEAPPPAGRPAGPGARGQAPTGYQVVDADPAEEYNLTTRLGAGPFEAVVAWWSSAAHVKVSVSPTGVQIARTTGRQTKVLADRRARFARNTPILVKVRTGQVTAVVGATHLTAVTPNLQQGLVAARGAASEVEFQAVEPVYFTDDFMRTNDETGGWTTTGGRWETAPVQNPDMGANPFSYKVSVTGQATALNGYEFWDDYRFTAALRPTSPAGRVGLGLYAQDDRNLYVFAARILAGPERVPDGFQMLRVVDGQATVLASAPGGLTTDQWYQVQVKADGPWLGAFVDGAKILAVQDGTYTSGKLALWADQAQGRFDDVVAEAITVGVERDQQLHGRVPDYAGLIDVDSWAGPATPWEPAPDQAGLFWRRNTFFGDVALRMDLGTMPDGATALVLADGDGESAGTGISLLARRDGPQASIELRRGSTTVGRTTAATRQGLAIEIRRSGPRALGVVNGRTALEAPLGLAPGGGRLAFRVTGWQPKVSTLSLTSTNLCDYTFDTAPVDWWVASGTWDVTNRWSCTPDWSWFGGFSAQIAAIFYKRPLAGDQVLDFYVGPKMMGDGFRQKERIGDFNAILCGDGQSVDSGYAFVVAPENGGVEIRRNGQVRARNDRFRIFRRGHNRWANVRAERHGDRLELYVDGQLVLSCSDSQPLPGGYAGLWTQNNGVMLPRITMSYEKLGEARLSLPAP